MKKINNILVLLGLAAIMAGCSMFGLDLQEDYNRTSHTLDAHLNTTAWDYMKTRNYIIVTDTIIAADGVTKTVDTVGINDVARLTVKYTTEALNRTTAKYNPPVTSVLKIGKVLKVDTIFTMMIKGILYCGIDTNEYIKPNRTLILLHNDAILRVSSGKPYADCFFGAVLVSGKVISPLAWNKYPQDFVKNYFQYLILLGQYNHSTLLTLADSVTNTLLTQNNPTYFQHLPAGITQPGGNPTGTASSGAVPAFIDAGTGSILADGSNNSTMYIQVVNYSPSNTSDYPVQLNDYLNVRTSDLIANGYDENGNLVPNSVSVQVIDRYLTTNLPY
ncbi:MAG TPA: hypothetical protein VIH57_14460 [Bacteroidales bacterium]